MQARGVISLCANPDSLPHASNKPDAPGFQIEIGRALAKALGFPLQVDWIVARMRASLVDCDMLLDVDRCPGGATCDPSSYRTPIRRAVWRWRCGRAATRCEGFQDIAPDQRVGVMVNSLASKLLNQRGLRTVPYAFESDMVIDLAKGELDACAVSPASIAYYIHTHPGSGPALRPRLRCRARAALESRRRPAPQRRCAARRDQLRTGQTDPGWHAGTDLCAVRGRISKALGAVVMLSTFNMCA